MLDSIKAVFSKDRGNDATANKAQQLTSFMSAASSASTMPIMMVDRDLTIIYVNDATKRLIRDNLAVFRTLVPSVDSERMIGICIDVFHKNPSHQRQMLSDPSRLPHRADIAIGDLRFSLNVSAVFDGARNYIGNVLEWKDVSQQRVNEGMITALDRSQAIIEFALDGRIQNANRNFLDAMGYTLDEIRGQHHSIFVDPNYRLSPEYRAFWERLGRGEFDANKYKRIAKGGREIWIQASYNPILDQAGKPYKVVKFATDITAAENEANELKAKMVAIGRSQAVIEFDLDGKILGANENFLATMGYSSSEIVGRHHSMFADPDYAKSGEYRMFWERLGRGEFIADKFRRLGRGGKEIWIQASYNPLVDLNGKPFKVVKFATDITAVENERKAAEAERAERAAEQAHVVTSLAHGLKQLSVGDLTERLQEAFAGEYEQLRQDFNGTVDRLHDTVKSVVMSTSGISTGASEISQATDDLSKRTEQQAAALEESAAALEQITATVKTTAQNAKEAKSLATSAKAEAEEGRQIVDRAVGAMQNIDLSSKEIGEIVSVIDEIAFQTNLLALNAGVEAARAGDAGKGFAVVASEVRALAQRSSESAREIKAKIKASGEHVAAGVKLVGESGQALLGIVDSVSKVDMLVTEISQAAQQQSTGIEEVNTAVTQMDQVTQQNAAMVEQSTAASRSLAGETADLGKLVSFFKVNNDDAPASRTSARGGAIPISAGHHAAPRQAPRPQPKAAAVSGRRMAAGLAVKADKDDWQEF